MSEWQEVTLQDVVTVLGDGLHGTPIYDDKGEYYFVNGNNLSNGKILLKESTRRTSEAEYLKYKKPLNNRTILLSINGTLGNVALYNNEKCFLGKSACYFNVKESVDKQFIRYVVTNKDFQTYITEFAHGTTIQNLSLKTLREFPFELPPPTEQKAIASVLSSLDDKIDLLHRQNTTLESMAETLFRQWFVEDAQEDWEECTLDDLITVKGGTTPSTKELSFWNGDINWTSPRDLSNQQSVFMFDTERKITEKGLAQIGSGLLPIGTLLMSSRAPIGYLAITDIPVAINQGYIAIVCDKLVSNFFMYLWCKVNMEQIKNAGNGSTFEEISKSNFKELSTLKPSKEAISKFNITVEPVFAKIKTNQKQIKTLEKLRDNLLPKLMSGEVRVEA